MKNREIKLEYARLRAEGLSYRAIAKQLGISRSTCSAWGKEMRLTVGELTAAADEAIVEAYKLTWDERVLHLDAILVRIEQEIMRRDFSEVDLGRLVYLAVHVGRLRNAMEVQPSGDGEPITINFLDDYGGIEEAVSATDSDGNEVSEG